MLVEIVSKADIMVWRQQQAGAFTLKPLTNGCDFVRRGLLLGKNVVEPEHQERVSVGQNSFVNGQFIARLVNALKHGNRMAGCLPSNLLEAQGGAVEEGGLISSRMGLLP